MKRAKLLIPLCASLVLCSCGSIKSDGVYKVVAYETEVENYCSCYHKRML